MKLEATINHRKSKGKVIISEILSILNEIPLGSHKLVVAMKLREVMFLMVYSICIETRGGIYGDILPEPKGSPNGKAQGISQGLRLYFTVYPDPIQTLTIAIQVLSFLGEQYWKS